MSLRFLQLFINLVQFLKFCLTMSKKKGVSAEEKKTRMLQLFHEKKEFFQLKELEKIAPKEKGIIAQSVKDVVQILVDDGLVDTDKIGTSVYYWAYPSKARIVRENKLKEVKEKLAVAKQRLESAKIALSEVKAGKDDGEERTAVLERVEALRKKQNELTAEIAKYKDNDPEVLETMKAESQKIKEAANRWTDNIFSVKSWCKKTFSIEESILDKQFGIPEDLDYID